MEELLKLESQRERKTMVTTEKKKTTSLVDLTDVKFTYQDYLEFPDDGKRFQIINGELIMSPSPRMMHQFIVRNLTHALTSFLLENPLGVIIPSPADVVLSETDVVQPDILVILNENKECVTETNISGVPDFVVEILSPYNRRLDVKRKRTLYEYYGVKEYWIVDPDLESVQKLILRDGKYIDGGLFEEDKTVASEVIKGFSISMMDMFRRW